MMEKYNFQIQQDGVNWEDTPMKALEFIERTDAASFARNLALFHDKEVRMSPDDNFYEGSYFSPMQAQRFFNNGTTN